jgi:hypothetical protein
MKSILYFKLSIILIIFVFNINMKSNSYFDIRIIYTPQFSVALFIYMLYYSTKGVEI